MNPEIDTAPLDASDFKLVCERCGGLTVAMPLEIQAQPRLLLQCGRCGAPRGTPRALRERSGQDGHNYPGL